MKKYRLKNQIAQMALDAITNGEFTKRLNGDIEISIERLGSIEHREAEYGYAAKVHLKPKFLRLITITLDCKDLEEVTE